jgi:glucose uptake protein GlcU
MYLLATSITNSPIAFQNSNAVTAVVVGIIGVILLLNAALDLFKAYRQRQRFVSKHCLLKLAVGILLIAVFVIIYCLFEN